MLINGWDKLIQLINVLNIGLNCEHSVTQLFFRKPQALEIPASNNDHQHRVNVSRSHIISGDW